MPQAKILFKVVIGESDTGLVAKVFSIVERRETTIEAFNMRLLLQEISKVIKKRRSFLRRFPFQPSPIVTVEESLGAPSRLIMPNGE